LDLSDEKNIDQWWTVPGDAGGVLELRQLPMPTPKTGGVLIKVHAAGVNRGELISKPALRSDDPLARPRPSGIECAGEIAALGDAVYGWQIGDRVMTRGIRCHATYATADAASLMAIPEHLNYLEAAAIPNVFITAHDAMVSQAKVQAGEAILITAGSSGVGSAALQIATDLETSIVPLP
jgi:NADPH2:quinone reductase